MCELLGLSLTSGCLWFQPVVYSPGGSDLRKSSKGGGGGAGGRDLAFEIPSEGDEWHRIRAGSAVALPAPRSHALKNLIKSLIAPNPSDRPTAAAATVRRLSLLLLLCYLWLPELGRWR